MTLLAERDAIALALINHDQRMLDLTELGSMDEVRSEHDQRAFRSLATAVVLCLTARGWVPPPGGG